MRSGRLALIRTQEKLHFGGSCPQSAMNKMLTNKPVFLIEMEEEKFETESMLRPTKLEESKLPSSKGRQVDSVGKQVRPF